MRLSWSLTQVCLLLPRCLTQFLAATSSIESWSPLASCCLHSALTWTAPNLSARLPVSNHCQSPAVVAVLTSKSAAVVVEVGCGTAPGAVVAAVAVGSTAAAEASCNAEPQRRQR